MLSPKELFDKQNEVGKKGEYLTINYLLAHGYKVEDISDNYGLHTDLLLRREDDTTFMVEVKHDTMISKTCNFFFETAIHYDDGREVLGWIHHTKADYVFYIDAVSGKTYILDWKKLYPLIKDNSIAAPIKTCRDGNKSVDGICVQYNSSKIKPAMFGIIRDIRGY